jgi:hypothetical protein
LILIQSLIMKFTIATMASLAGLFSQTLALEPNGVYAIQSPHSKDAWGAQYYIGSKHQVVLEHPKNDRSQHWRFVPSGPDYWVENVGTQGTLACPAADRYRCGVDTLGNNAQEFTVKELHNGGFTIHPKGSGLVVGTVEGPELKALPQDSAVDAVFKLLLTED